MGNPFADVAPVTEDVEIGGQRITLRPVSLGLLAQLAVDHPDLAAMWAEGRLDMAVVLRQAPQAAFRLLAAAAGAEGEKEAIEGARKLGAPDQVRLLMAAMRISLPDEVRPMVTAAVSAMIRAAAGAIEDIEGGEEGPETALSSPAGSTS